MNYFYIFGIAPAIREVKRDDKVKYVITVDKDSFKENRPVGHLRLRYCFFHVDENKKIIKTPSRKYDTKYKGAIISDLEEWFKKYN